MVDRGWLRKDGMRVISDRGHSVSVGERYFIDRLPLFLTRAD